MIRNYIVISVRNILKHRAYSLINIVGLASGIACCILMLMYVKNELSFDRFHQDADRIYRLARTSKIGNETFSAATTAAKMGSTLEQDYPAVTNVTRFFHKRSQLLFKVDDKRFHESGFFYVDESVFDVFSFPLKSGDPKAALRDPFSLVLTQDIAEKYFDKADPIGKVISVDKIDFKITGVLHNIPKTSHLDFKFLASMSSLQRQWPNTFEGLGGWFNNMFYTYLLLHEPGDAAALEQQFPAFVQKHLAQSFGAVTESDYELALSLEPITSIHLHSDLLGQISSGSDIRYVYILLLIAFLILLVACINFMNLATARSAHRAREVGVRKAAGAQRWQLMQQFVSEAMILSMVALVLGLIIVDSFLPVFNNLSGRELRLGFFDGIFTWIVLTGVVLLVGLMAGSYPSFFLSSFRPVHVLSPGSRSRTRSRPLLRQILVIFQFVISVALIISTTTIHQQLDYMQNKKLGFDEEQLALIPLLSPEMRQKYRTLKNELLQHPNVLAATAASGFPGQRLSSDGFPVFPEGIQDNWVMQTTFVDYDFLETMEMELVQGRDFYRAFVTDQEQAFILNETAVEALGWRHPIGKTLRWEGNRQETKEGQVIGVVKDYHYDSLHEKIQPLILHIQPRRYNALALRIRVVNMDATLSFLESTWRNVNPDGAFEYSFLDQNFAAQYQAELRVSKVFDCFSLLAIVISCLGLFGLISFTAEQRTKEVGVRKVLGATATNVTILLTKDFLKPVLVANLLAWPMAWYVMKEWLQNFAYRVDLSIWIFALAGGLALLIALVTVSTQAIRAALANPVESLRYE